MISELKLSQLSAFCEKSVLSEDQVFEAVSTDSRSLKAGDLFFALRGDNFDGHDFVVDAVNAGACAVVVDVMQKGISVPQLVVEDTTRALGLLGALNRKAFSGPVVGVTGSSGKTTVKEILASILACRGKVLATRGNLNNHIGVPMMLLDIESSHQYAVIEMGASAVGEIDYLSRLTRPTVAVITNISQAHIEGFGSLENIVKAKSEIFHGLDAEGIAVINLDEAYSVNWLSENNERKTVTFSRSRPADITVAEVDRDEFGRYSFQLKCQQDTVAVTLPLLGEHNIRNALTAAACAYALEVDIETIAKGLEKVSVVPGRMEVKSGLCDSTVIDDSYNANPASVSAAIDVLSTFSGKKVLVLGDMAELGEESEKFHQEVGAYAARKNIDCLLSIGELSKQVCNDFSEARNFTEKSQLINACQDLAAQDVIFLVKGSRSSGMNEVVTVLTSDGRGVAC